MSGADILLRHFPGAAPDGKGGWRTRCPAHDGGSPNSLSIAPRGDGGWLIHCFSGCPADAICKAVGLTLRDLAPANGAAHNGHGANITSAAPAKSKGRPFATLDAAIAAGARLTGGTLGGRWLYPCGSTEADAVAAAVRYNTPGGGKAFRPLHRGDDGWRFGDPAGKWPIYGEAGSPRTFLVEGEACCDAVLRLGVPCITSAHGSNGAGLTDWSGVRDVEIVALPDHDAPGREYVGRVAAILRGQGCTVRAVRLADAWPDLPEGGDIADLLGPDGAWSGRDDADVAAALQRLADAAPEWAPECNTGAVVNVEPPPALPERWRFYSPSDLLAMEDEAAAYVVDGLFAPECITLLAGRPKGGKTSLLAAIVRAMEHGGRLLGAIHPGRAIVISEASRRVWRARLKASRIGDHLTIMPRPFETRPTLPEWETFARFVARRVVEAGVSLVAVDTIAGLGPIADENDSSQVQAAVNALAVIAEAGAAVGVLHHSRKADGEEMTGVRGSGAFVGAVDIVAELRLFKPGDYRDPRRVLTTIGRFDDLPPETVLERLADGTYRALGDKAQAKGRDLWRTLAGILTADEPGMSIDEIMEAFGGDDPPSRTGVQRELNRQQGTAVLVSGGGKRGDPFRYRLAGRDSILRPTLMVAAVESNLPPPLFDSTTPNIGVGMKTNRLARENGCLTQNESAGPHEVTEGVV